MNARELITELSLVGARFDVEGEGFRISAPRGIITPELRDELTERKPEILALLKQMDVEVSVTYIVGDCPHCKQPLLVFTCPLDDEVWVQCGTNPETFKALKHDGREWCRDCADKLNVIAGRCAECVQRLMLAPDDPCSMCGGSRFWRHLASKSQPAGFAWRCAKCEGPMGKAAFYELTAEPKQGVESLCPQQPIMF